MSTLHRHGIELLERLGGSSAEVHRAVLRASGTVVVAKHVGWDRPTVAERLGREAAVLRRHRHPALVRLVGQVDDEHGRCLLLAHAPGGSLSTALARRGPLPAPEVAALGARLAGALAVLHADGVTHRDVQPANVVFDAELQPVLLDLDQALSAVDEPLPDDTAVVGHPDHVDGRVLAGAPADAASDLHALATTLWTCVTGSPPHRAPTGEVELPDHPLVPRALRAVLHRCVRGEAGGAAVVARGLDRLATVGRPPVPFPTTDAADAPASPPFAARVAALRETLRSRRATVLTTSAALATAAAAAAAVAWPADPTGAVTGTAVTAPPACDVTALANLEGAVLADLDGDGCSEVATLRDGELHLPSGRYAIGRAGDQLLAGDWDGDGRWGVGLYRPGTGEVFLIDDPGPGATSRPVRDLAPEGVAVVVDTGDAHDVRVEHP